MTEVPPWRPTETEYLYVQVARHLEARILAGELEPGRRLPPERELAAEYQTAFHTMRRAIAILREQGLIVTLHGRGTYVAEREGPVESG